MLSIVLPISTLLVLFLDFSDTLLKLLSVVEIIVLSYLSSYSATQKYREKGALQGLAIGFAISVFLLITTLIINKGISDFCITKLFSCIISSLLGGIIGVNTRKTKVK